MWVGSGWSCGGGRTRAEDLAGQARAVLRQARIEADRAPRAPAASSLTAAELRLLPLLATHLSFP